MQRLLAAAKDCQSSTQADPKLTEPLAQCHILCSAFFVDLENIGKHHFVRQLVFTMVFRGFKLKEVNISAALDFNNKDTNWRFFDYLLPMSHNLNVPFFEDSLK